MLRPQQRPGGKGKGAYQHHQQLQQLLQGGAIGGDPYPSGPITCPATLFYKPTKKLYHRQVDIDKLIGAYDRRKVEPQLVLLVGQPGNGKTTLGHAIRPRVEQDGGYFAVGRFDPLDYPEPYGPLLDICDQLIDSIIRAGGLPSSGSKSQLQLPLDVISEGGSRSGSRSASGASTSRNSGGDAGSLASASSLTKNKDAKVFVKAMKATMALKEMQAIATVWPQLGTLLNVEAAAPNKANSLVVAVLQIFRALSKMEKPIVLLLDDLHFAEKASLEVMKLALADPRISAAFFVMVAFRPVNVQHPSSVWLQTLEAGGVKFLPLVPSPIDRPDVIVNEWMADVFTATSPKSASGVLGLENNTSNLLGLPEEQLQKIGQTIAKETQGNACAIQLCLQIMALNDEIVRQTGGTPLQAGGDVRSLFQLLFMMLSPTCQKACWTASCMGMVIDVGRLKRIIGEEGLEEALEEGAKHGVLQFIENNSHTTTTTSPSGTSSETDADAAPPSPGVMDDVPKRRDLGTGFYAFASLTYRDCVYGLIAPKDRNMQHTAIGNIYRNDMDSTGVYRVVEHLSLGRELLSPKQLQAFAKLCLTAGDLSTKWGEFQSAARHYDLGIGLLDSIYHNSNSHKYSKWKGSDYNLTLSLYNGSAAVYSSLGEFEEMDARLMEILNHAKDTNDKVKANVIQVKALVSQTRHSDAMALGLKVLPKLEEPIKKYSSESELKATRKLLEGKSEERILASSSMEDEKKVGAMEIMNSLVVSAMVEQGDLVISLACRIVKATLRYGLTGVSAVGLCMLGAILCCDGEIDDGLWCSNCGLELIEMIEDKSCKGRVMAIHWGLMIRFVQPLKTCQDPLKLAYRLCVEGGDNDFALITPMFSAFNMVVAGGTLSSTTEAMKSLYQLLHKKNQDTLLRIVRPFFQMALNLLGVSTETDPTILTGSIMVEQDDYAYATQTRNRKIEYCILLCQTMLAFYLHKFENARLLMEKCTAIKDPGMLLSNLDIHVCFFDAMTAIGMAWVWIRKLAAHEDMDKKEKKHLTDQKGKLISHAQGCLGRLRMHARHAPANLTQRVHIIQAELNAINGNVAEADKLFQKAMAHAEEHGQFSDKALACERAGLAMRSCGKEDDALNYLEDCCAMYRQWGALIKVNHVKGNVIPQAIYEWDV